VIERYATRPAPVDVSYTIRISNILRGKTVTSIFRCEVVEKCALLGYYAASSGNLLPTFRDNLSVPSSGVEDNNNNNMPVITQKSIFLKN